MNNIEFLPKKYKERRSNSQIQVSFTLVIGLLVTVLLIPTIFQVISLQRVWREIAAIEEDYNRVQELRMSVGNKQHRVETARHHAQLLTYLMHPHPRSQILSTVTNPLPDEILVRRIHIGPMKQGKTLRLESEAEAETKNLPPMLADLQQLVNENSARRLHVKIEGTTQDTGILYEYLANLHNAELIAGAKIESIDPKIELDGTEVSDFTAFIQLKRGHAQMFDAYGQQTAGNPASGRSAR